MRQETKNRMAEIIAAATAKVKANDLQNNITGSDIEHIAADIVSEEQTTIQEPVKMQSFTIIWHEGIQRYENSTFNTWAKANEAMRWISNQHEGLGYTKVKINVKWEDGSEITDRVDCSDSNGDFKADRDTIGSYLSRQNSVMYSSNLEKGTRSRLQWEDEIKHPETITPVQPLSPSPEKPQNTLKMVDYSDKAFAVIGDTKPIKNQLKDLGGRFNAFLKCGAGWIFPKTKLAAVRVALNITY